MTTRANPDPPRLGALGEFGRIARYLRPLAAGCPGALDLTDDAAVLAVPPDHELVVTTDAMVAGIHFLPDDPPADIAAKLLRVNLSDLAAMAASPLGYTLVLSLPRSLDEAWLAGFAAGLAADQERYGIALIGGDSVSTRGPITVSVTALGLVPKGRALTRKVRAAAEQRAHQLVFVTGTIGDAALGLKLVLGELAAETLAPETLAPETLAPETLAPETLDDEAAGFLVERLRRPEPRLALAQDLRDVATAAIDVSDGLVADLGHIAERTGCAARVEAARLPLSNPVRTLLARRPELLATVVTGGDDYELVFTAPPGREPALAALATRHGVAITAIGRLEPGPAGRVEVLDLEGKTLALKERGWTHFST